MDPAHLQTIELMKAAKPLFESGEGYLIAAVSALGAIGGAIAAYVPNRLMAKHQQAELRKSTAFQLYSEIRATLEVVQHRGYIESLRDLLASFDRKEILTCTYKVQVPDERFIIFKSNLGNLGLLPPGVQGQIVLLYQLLEAVIQDVKPGGMLNAEPAGRGAFAEALTLSERAKTIAEQVLIEIEKLYPDVALPPLERPTPPVISTAHCTTATSLSVDLHRS